jgi:hypothetical protein
MDKASIPTPDTSTTWKETLGDMAIRGWKTKIETQLKNGHPLEFLINDDQSPWIKNVLVPFLNREGLVARMEKHPSGGSDYDHLIVTLQ